MESIAILVIEKGRARVMRFRVELTGEANWSLACHTTQETLKRLRPDLVTVVDSENRARRMAEEIRRQGRADAVILLHPESAAAFPGQTHISLSGGIDPSKPKELVLRLAQALLAAQAKAPANPLTGLPGAGVLRAAVEQRIAANEIFSFLYIDLDNFKSYNDHYGFAKGDEVIQLLAKLVTESIAPQSNLGDLCIHIGGDDFGILTIPARAEKIAKDLIQRFDAAAPDFYEEPERSQGFIVTHDRQGKEARFPIMTLSVAGVSNAQRHIDGYLHLSEIAAEIKAFAKQSEDSTYVMDRRRNSHPSKKTNSQHSKPKKSKPDTNKK